MRTGCSQDLFDFGVRWAKAGVIQWGKIPPGKGAANHLVASVAGASGNGAVEAYTASLWGARLSRVIEQIAEAETVPIVEGYMRRRESSRGATLCQGVDRHRILTHQKHALAPSPPALRCAARLRPWRCIVTT